MSAKSSDVFIVLPINARNMDSDVSSGETDTMVYERILKKLVVSDTELLAVTEWAFYYLNLVQPAFLARDKLYYILTDGRLKSSPLIKRLRKAITTVPMEKKPFIAFTLISHSFPEYLFNLVDAPLSIPDFVEVLVEYAKESREAGIEWCECREVENPREKHNIYRMFYGSYLDALELLKVNYSYGETNGEPCIVIDRRSNRGIIITSTS